VTPIVVEARRYDDHFIVHILRKNDVRKRLVFLVRDFLLDETEMDEHHASAVLASTRSVARDTDLTKREVEVVGLTAQGKTSKGIVNKLSISTATVNNHTQSILKKLNSHSRLEAVRRAERAWQIRSAALPARYRL
jgi:DNA-binding NarL/FixJ family response regulator